MKSMSQKRNSKNRDSFGRFVNGHRSGMTGKEHSDETKKKIGRANKGHKFYGGKSSWFKKGERVNPKTEFKEGNTPWNIGMGITPEEHKFRMSKKYNEWRIMVFERDNYTCQMCGKRGGKIQADHIKSYAKHKELRTSVGNGRTLCVECHKKTDTFGWNLYNNL